MIPTYGTIELRGRSYVIDAAPHVRSRLRRIFVSANSGRDHQIVLSDTLSNAEDLDWVLERYPLEPINGTIEHLKARANESRLLRDRCETLMHSNVAPKPVPTSMPLRDYQLRGVEMLNLRRRLLVGDDLGLGKTAIALGAIASGAWPAIVVCQTHLQQQWVNEARKFLGRVIPHIVKKSTPYKLPVHNVLVIPYSKLIGWRDALQGYKIVIFDECQELRREGSQKYGAACQISSACEMALMLSATPIYNYGDEMFSVLNAMDDGCLGTRDEFLREWCQAAGGYNYMVTDPKALGAWLAENQLMLRRRRSDVGKELPAITRVTEDVGHDANRVKEAAKKGAQLAHAVLSGAFTERGQAARELDNLMRQQTGIAKAPYVADFVADMVRSGEKVVLCGWHREVYAIWQNVFQTQGIKHVFYTGSESTTQKLATVKAFVEGDAQVFIMSLRSGAGLNSLQNVANVIVFGELDWSPQVHEQCIGRLNRDGQTNPVTAVFLTTEAGSDPSIAAVLGLKREQSQGIINPDEESDVATQQVIESRGAALARAILHSNNP